MNLNDIEKFDKLADDDKLMYIYDLAGTSATDAIRLLARMLMKAKKV